MESFGEIQKRVISKIEIEDTGMAQKIRKERITKKEFYDMGGFARSDLFRQQSRGGSWRYYRSLERLEA